MKATFIDVDETCRDDARAILELVTKSLKRELYSDITHVIVTFVDERWRNDGILPVAENVAWFLGIRDVEFVAWFTESIIGRVVGIMDWPPIGARFLILNCWYTNRDILLSLVGTLVRRYLLSHPDIANEIADAFIDESGARALVDELIKTVEAMPINDDAKRMRINDIMNDLDRLRNRALDFATEILAANYFLLMNTKPFDRIIQLCRILNEYFYAPLDCPYMGMAIKCIINDMLSSAKLSEVPLNIARIIHEIKGRFLDLSTTFPRFAQAIHKLFNEVVQRPPKEVCREMGSRCNNIFKPINLQDVRAKGLPVMDEI